MLRPYYSDRDIFDEYMGGKGIKERMVMGNCCDISGRPLELYVSFKRYHKPEMNAQLAWRSGALLSTIPYDLHAVLR